MSTVGTVVRDPGIVALPCPSTITILRGQLVSFTPGVGGANGAVKIPAATTDRIYGIATSDSDPDTLYVSVAVKGGYTLSMAPTAGQVFQQGQIAYQDQTAFNTITGVVTASKIIGWVVNQQPDSLGNLEIAFFTDLEA
jgi:hypothetical protein